MRIAWIPLALLFACGGTEQPEPAPAPVAPTSVGGSEPSQPDARPEPATPLELVELLREIATGPTPARVDEYVDHDFAERLASTDDLAELFRGWPEGCVAAYEEGEGYGAVAIPPPMVDDPPAEVTRIEGLIAELSASTEISASCDVVEVYQDEADAPATPHESTRMLFAIAIRRDAAGRWRAMAWRNFLTEDPLGH